MPVSGGDVGPASVAEQREDRIAQCRHDLRPVAGAGLADIFAASDVPDQAGLVLNARVPSPDGDQGRGIVAVAGDGVAHLTGWRISPPDDGAFVASDSCIAGPLEMAGKPVVAVSWRTHCRPPCR